jgi:hypothetical protein
VRGLINPPKLSISDQTAIYPEAYPLAYNAPSSPRRLIMA